MHHKIGVAYPGLVSLSGAPAAVPASKLRCHVYNIATVSSDVCVDVQMARRRCEHAPWLGMERSTDHPSWPSLSVSRRLQVFTSS